MMRFQDLKPGQHFVVATEGMRGHFACEMWINNEDEDKTFTFPEPWQSDFMSYKTHLEAVERAKVLAEELKLPYVQ